MAYHLSQFAGGAVVAVDGKMDEAFLQNVQKVLSKGLSYVLINLEKSQAIRGDHMEWMVEAHHLCDKAGGAMALTDVPKDFRYILSIMELDQFFRLFETQEEGQRIFAQAAEAAASVPAADDSVIPGDASVLQVMELEDAGPAAEPAEEAAPKSRRQLQEEREARVELFVRYVAPGMVYLYVFDALAKGGSRKFDVKGLARASRQKAGQVAEVVAHLVELRICQPLQQKGLYAYNPGQAAREDIAEFLRMWNNPNNHGKVYKWVYAEEQSRGGGKRSFSSKIRRLFGK